MPAHLACPRAAEYDAENEATLAVLRELPIRTWGWRYCGGSMLSGTWRIVVVLDDGTTGDLARNLDDGEKEGLVHALLRLCPIKWDGVVE